VPKLAQNKVKFQHIARHEVLQKALKNCERERIFPRGSRDGAKV